MKIVFDMRTGQPVEAHEDPLDGGYLMPAFSVEEEPPAFDPELQKCEFIEGNWVLTDIPIPEPVSTAPIDLMQFLRDRRDDLLLYCDFRVLPDYQGSDVEAWKTYRQALRDVPQNNPNPTWDEETSDLANVNWPTPPST